MERPALNDDSPAPSKGDPRDEAYRRAVRLLGIRARSRMEIHRYLTLKGYGLSIIQSVTDQLTQEGYLADLSFSREWVASRSRQKPKSAFALAWELRQKGISETDIEKATAGLDEPAAAWTAATAKLKLWRPLEKAEFQRKMMMFLKRRGFSSEIIRETVARALKERGDDLDLHHGPV